LWKHYRSTNIHKGIIMNATTNNYAAAIAINVLDVATATIGTDKAKAMLALNLAAAFASVPVGNLKAFSVLFGNGDAPKSKTYQPGSIAVAVREKIAKVAKDKQTTALNILKTRLSECRRAFRGSVVLANDETVQAAIKRLPHDKKAETPNTGAPAGGVSSWIIPASATAADVAEALSIWVAEHGAATASGLAHLLPDFMPVSVKRAKAA
jgi:hypothetical protein